MPLKADASYLANDNVSLSAVPAMGYVFQSWTGNTDGIADLSQPNVNFVMGTDRAITANFVASQATYTVTASCDPAYGGAITLTPDQSPYLVNQVITASTNANQGYVFSHWSGDMAGTDLTGNLRVDGDKSITAVFYPILTVQQNTAAAGAVDVTPAATAGGYPAGTAVQLTAHPAIGYVFTGWTGDVDGMADASARTVSVVMNAGRTITANFAGPLSFKVAAASEAEGCGSIALDPVQPADGYLANQQIKVYASPAPGYVFVHWTGDAGGAASVITLCVDGQKILTAVFHPKVTAESEPVEGGSVEITPSESSNAYVPGTLITVIAKPNKGYRFSSWDYDLSGKEDTVTATVDGPMTIKAIFVKKPPSRTWIWPVFGIVGLLAVFVLARVVYRKGIARRRAASS